MKLLLNKKIGVVTLLETLTTVYPTTKWWDNGKKYVLEFKSHLDWLDCCRDSQIVKLLDDYLHS